MFLRVYQISRIYGLPFFLTHGHAWCSAIKTMNDHNVRDEVDDWPEYLIAGQQQRHRFLT